MSYASRVKESVFDWDDRGNLVIENAVIFWTNFKGEATRFNPQGGKRTLNVAIPEEMVEDMRDDGWNIKRRDPRDDQDDVLYFTECVLNMNSKYEPRVMLCTEWKGKKTMTALHGDSVGKLDDIRCENVDLVIHPHRHDAGCKGYVNTIVATQAKTDLFGGKYDDYDVGDARDEDPDNEGNPW